MIPDVIQGFTSLFLLLNVKEGSTEKQSSMVFLITSLNFSNPSHSIVNVFGQTSFSLSFKTNFLDFHWSNCILGGFLSQNFVQV